MVEQRGRYRLSGFGAHMGAPHAVADLDEPAQARDVLIAGGFEAFRVTDDTPPALARAALAATLAGATVAPDRIGAVVWVTTSFDHRDWYTRDVSEVLLDLGLTRADVIGVTLSECGNLGPALRTAISVATDLSAPVALVCTDAAGGGRSRVVAPNVAVLSDGAVSCLVGLDAGKVSIESVGQATNHALRRLDPKLDSVRVLRTTSLGVARAAQVALARAGLAAREVDALLLPSYARSAQALFAHQCGIELGLVRTPTMAACGHLFAGDVLAGLPILAEQLPAGSIVLAITAGTCTWSAAVLRILEG